MTSKDWAEKTVRDIARKIFLKEEGKRQATAHSIANMEKTRRRLK